MLAPLLLPLAVMVGCGMGGGRQVREEGRPIPLPLPSSTGSAVLPPLSQEPAAVPGKGTRVHWRALISGKCQLECACDCVHV